MFFHYVQKLQSFGLSGSQTQSWIRSWFHKSKIFSILAIYLTTLFESVDNNRY